MRIKIRIIVADDIIIIRDGLRLLLEKQNDFEVVGEAYDEYTLIQSIRHFQPDVLLMDTLMPNINIFKVTKRLMDECPKLKIIILTPIDFEKWLIAKMFIDGASGYLHKACDAEQIGHAIRAVTKGKQYISDSTSSMIFNDIHQYLSERNKFYEN